MRELTARNGRPMPTVAVIPPTSIAATSELARAGGEPGRAAGLGQQAGQVVGQTPLGPVRDGRGHRGIAHRRHPPTRWWSRVGRFAAVGVEHLVFDLRMNFDRWFASVELLGREVLPALRG